MTLNSLTVTGVSTHYLLLLDQTAPILAQARADMAQRVQHHDVTRFARTFFTL
jgi:hypothetical protein